MKVLFVAVMAISIGRSPVALATDADTDCEGHFDKWYQEPDLLRCQAERELARQTGITNCDVFRLPVLDQLYNGAQTTIEVANMTDEWPRTASDCHAMIDGIATGGAALGGLTFAKKVYDIGLKAAAKGAVSVSSLAQAGAVEVAKSFAHCACKHATYLDPDRPRTTHGMYQISVIGKDNYSLWRGANNESNRNELKSKASDGVDNKILKSVVSTFAVDRRTLTEAICKEGSIWEVDKGGESSRKAFARTKEKGWTQCLFRTVNWVRNEPPVLNDRTFTSVTKDYRWALRTGAKDKADEVQDKAIKAVGGSYDHRRRGYFTSTRPTRTYYTCEQRSESSGDLSTTESLIGVAGGLGYESVKKAIETAEKDYGTSAWCRFDINDVGFGPVPEFDFN